MRAMFGLVLVAGVGLAGAAVFMAKNYISKTETALERELALKAETGGLVEVYVVTKAVNYGEPLTRDDVQKSYLPKNALPENTFADIAILFPEDKTEPRYVLRQMEKFEPILSVKVTEPGEQAGLTGALERGMRAFSIKVEAADYLQPGGWSCRWSGLATTPRSARSRSTPARCWASPKPPPPPQPRWPKFAPSAPARAPMWWKSRSPARIDPSKKRKARHFP